MLYITLFNESEFDFFFFARSASDPETCPYTVVPHTSDRMNKATDIVPLKFNNVSKVGRGGVGLGGDNY